MAFELPIGIRMLDALRPCEEELRMHRTIVSIMVLLLAVASRLSLAQDRYDEWRPVTAVDWQVAENDSLGIHHAVIIYDGTIIDDRDLAERTTLISWYLRVRVFDQKGMEDFRTVEIPFPKGARILKLKARTLKSDGREVEVGPEGIYEKTVLSYGSKRIKSKALAFKGLEAGDILEYFCVQRWEVEAPPLVRLRHPNYTLQTDVLWYYRPLPPLSQEDRLFLKEYLYTARWAVTNANRFNGTIEELPSVQRPDRIHVSYKNLPALPEEPYMPAEEEVAAQFLGSYHYPNEKRPYWDRIAQAYGDVTLQFLRKQSRLEAWMGDLLAVGRDSTQDIDRCLALAHRDITNIDLLEDREMPEKVPDCQTVNDVLKNRLGSHTDINYVFLAMLRRLGYTATLFWTRDRSHGPFLKDWQTVSQFTMGGVVAKRGEKLQWIFPGLPFSDSHTIPWQVTGCRALLENLSGEKDQPGSFPTFADTPMGKPEWNKTSLNATLQMDSLGRAVGHLTVTWDCASDPAFPLRLSKMTKKEAVEELGERALWSGAKWTREDESFAQEGRTVTYSCSLLVENLLEEAGARKIVNLGLLHPDAYHLPAGARESVIQFRYPVSFGCTVAMSIPEGYTIDQLPQRSAWEDVFGRYTCESASEGEQVVRHRDLTFFHDIYRPEGAEPLRAFFEKVYAADGEPVVLRKVDLQK
jgi:hypothetical protein